MFSPCPNTCADLCSMTSFLRAQVILVACAVAQPPVPVSSLSRWADATGASASEGNVITCSWGVLCRHGFQRGKEEICESHFECVPSGVPVESAQVPQGQGTEHKPDVPAEGTAEAPAQVAPVPVPHKDAPDANAAGDATPAKPAASPVANVSHAEANEPQVSGTQQDVSGGDSAMPPPRRLRGAMSAQVVTKAGTDGQRRLNSRSRGHEIHCQCGVVCQWGSHMRGEERVCNGPLYCKSCMPMMMPYGAVGGV